VLVRRSGYKSGMVGPPPRTEPDPFEQDASGSAAPAPAAVELSLVLPRDAASIPVVRHLCEHALVELGCREDCAGDVGLAVTEACANVVTHAGPGESYSVQVSVDAERCELRVLDAGGAFVEAEVDASVKERALDPMSESGRGLAIIKAVTDDLSLESRPGSGTLVRMVKQVEFDEDRPARRLVVPETG